MALIIIHYLHSALKSLLRKDGFLKFWYEKSNANNLHEVTKTDTFQAWRVFALIPKNCHLNYYKIVGIKSRIWKKNVLKFTYEHARNFCKLSI